jgi:hypothetical protein
MRLALVPLALFLALALYVAGALAGFYGNHRGPGEVTQAVIPAGELEKRAKVQATAADTAGVGGAKQILFGDLHVHTTYSTDAFLWSLQSMSGEGAHPLGAACDFARFCSGLDFWSINDHAEASTPQKWAETVDSIRQCNAVSGEANPDTIAFLGWEWTQIGQTADEHWGHKNVILRDLEDEKIPARPINSGGLTRRIMSTASTLTRIVPAFLDFGNRQEYYDFDTFFREIVAARDCPEGVHVRELPVDCVEAAETPGVLFEKLAQWGVESLVIPHGTTWGMYTPADSTWDKQLASANHDPERQTLIEVFSGHGNSEEYRDWKAVEVSEAGVSCPAPTPDYLPSCWHAGELIRARCLEAGESEPECESRAVVTRERYVAAGQRGRHVVPGETASDWLDAGQCKDCFLPSFNYRPGGSAQYIAALRNFDEPNGPDRFRFGFIASSDVHTGRPGTGYKEFARTSMADQSGARDATTYGYVYPQTEYAAESVSAEAPTTGGLSAMQNAEVERQNSFWLTGGLAAVHTESRSRDGVWEAFERKEVYGTSGDRILLWFDLLNPPRARQRLPMGGEVAMQSTPVFEVRAVGAFEQKPGCPDYSVNALTPERVESLCRGECYHPSDTRKRITRLEVVRIRPQMNPGEPMGKLIEDPWKVFECPGDPAGCTAAFADPEFATARRDMVYYVRAIQEPTPTVNANNLRCEYDDAGNCVDMKPCWGDYRTPLSDECTDESEERAWSSPIYVDWVRDRGVARAN